MQQYNELALRLDKGAFADCDVFGLDDVSAALADVNIGPAVRQRQPVRTTTNLQPRPVAPGRSLLDSIREAGQMRRPPRVSRPVLTPTIHTS